MLDLLHHFPYLCGRGMVFPLLGSNLFQLDFQKNDRVFPKSSEDEDDAGNDPGLDGGETLGLWAVGLNCVEDVDEHQEDCDKEGHTTRNNLENNPIMIWSFIILKAINECVLLLISAKWS